MTVIITAQVPGVESIATSSQAAAPTQAGQGNGAPNEQGLVDYFAKAHLEAGETQTMQASNSAASSGEMLGKLREFVERANHFDARNHATRIKQKEAAAQATNDLAALDTFGSVGQFGSAGQSGSVSQSGAFGTSFDQYASIDPAVGLHPGPASESLGRGPSLSSQVRMNAVADKLINEIMESKIHNMWMQVATHGATSLSKSVKTLLQGQ